MSIRFGLVESSVAVLPFTQPALWVALGLPCLLGVLGAWLRPQRTWPILLAGLPLAASGIVLLMIVEQHGLQRWQLEWGKLTVQLRLNGLSVLLLLLTQGLGLVAALYTPGELRHADPAQRRLERWLWPLLGILVGSLSLIWVAADLLTLYVALELMGLSAVGMLLLPGKVESLVAGIRYLLLALVGSLSYLLGVALILGHWGRLDLAGLVQVVEAGPVAWTAAALLGAGLALKAALFPLHAWLAPVHGNAWVPVSALHAALVIKASLFILLQLWSVLIPDSLFAAQLVAWLGVIAIFWGGGLAWRAVELKSLVAYSTVAQMGYLMVVFPLLLGPGIPASVQGLAWQGFWLYLVGHALAKAAMFLAAGNLILATGNTTLQGLTGASRQLPLSLLAFGVASVSLIGLPPSAGFTAKWLLLRAMVIQAQWAWVAALLLGTLLSAAYVFRVFRYSFVETAPHYAFRALPPWLDGLALGLALASLLLGLFAYGPLTLLQGSR
ncbi:proton-conducting transporter membrane subunit [Vreelandella rituensis]|uniref:NADH-ubiquinone oxidoreductase n=1 Tax=Vreelandella rituensis TaxID=2282306 RepID=A0A368U9T1_9GAMM|nr:proton-conducting transporter membrane subunit [Halomonas rituensis]RCV93256.1 NADH-ubiquinone oxidoreductase [Halomonas rituensis]